MDYTCDWFSRYRSLPSLLGLEGTLPVSSAPSFHTDTDPTPLLPGPRGKDAQELTLLFPLQYPQSLCVVPASCFLVFHFWAQSICVNAPTFRRVHARMWFLSIHLSVMHPLRMQPSGEGGREGTHRILSVITGELLHTSHIVIS